MQKKLTHQWEEKHPALTLDAMHPSGTQVFDASSQDAHLDHHRNFYASIRGGKPLLRMRHLDCAPPAQRF